MTISIQIRIANIRSEDEDEYNLIQFYVCGVLYKEARVNSSYKLVNSIRLDDSWKSGNIKWRRYSIWQSHPLMIKLLHLALKGWWNELFEIIITNYEEVKLAEPL